jgi:uncharacterized membrane protein
MVSKSRIKKVEREQNKDSDYDTRVDADTKNRATEYTKSRVQELQNSEAIVSGLSGGLIALLYTIGFLPPTVWGGTLIYVPAFLAGLTSSLIYEGHRKNWKVGILAGLVSVLPLIVAITELYLNTGLEPNLLSTVTFSIVSAAPLGLIGSYVVSKYLVNRRKNS